MMIPADAENPEENLALIKVRFASSVVRIDQDQYHYQYVWSDDAAADRPPFAFSLQSKDFEELSGRATFDALFEETVVSFSSLSNPTFQLVPLKFMDETGKIVGSGQVAIYLPSNF